jgi:membrane dipeptidase
MSAPYRERGHTVPFVKKLRVIREYARQLPPVPFSFLIDHFDHLLHLVGPDHVGIGSDFDGIALSVEGMESAADMPKVTAALLERGWSANDLKGLLGENLLRVMAIAQERALASE